jgi:hypothetical protein
VQYHYLSEETTISVLLEHAMYNTPFRTDNFLKLTFEGNFKISYKENKNFFIRVFAGGFPFHSNRDFGYYPLQLSARSSTDYIYDQSVFDRSSGQTNILSQQVIQSEGGFKTPLPADGLFFSNTGTLSSNSFVASVNLSADIPIEMPLKIPFFKIKPYIDLGYANETSPTFTGRRIADEIHYNGGISIDIGSGFFGLYLPIFSDSNLSKLLDQRGGYGSKIGILLNLKKLDPFEKLRQLKRQLPL